MTDLGLGVGSVVLWPKRKARASKGAPQQRGWRATVRIWVPGIFQGALGNLLYFLLGIVAAKLLGFVVATFR